MPLVNVKCTNCGATLKVDDTQDAAVCEFCGSAYIVEKAIQNYYVTNNINADNVFVTGKGDAEKERLLKNAETNERFKDYTKASNIYEQVTEDYPNEYRGWLGLALIQSNNFNNTDLDFNEFNNLLSYTEKAIMCAPSEKSEAIQSQWSTYLDKYASFMNQQKSTLRDLQTQKMKLDNQILNIKRSIKENRESSKSVLSELSKLKEKKYNRKSGEGLNSLLGWGDC